MSPLLTLAAGAPILLVIGLLVLKVRAASAALIAVIAAVIVSMAWFPTDRATAIETGQTLGPLMLEVTLIILGGVLLAVVLTVSGAQTTIARWLADACPGRSRVVLLISLGVTPFAESVTGFGLGVIVGIPLLRHIGLSRMKSAVVALLGLVLAPWGALAPGTLIAAELGGVDFVGVGVWSAVFTLPVLLIATAAILVIALGRAAALRSIPDALLAVAALWLALIAANIWLGPPLAGVAASIVTILLLLGVARIGQRNPLSADRTLGRAVLPYGLLVLGLLTTSLLDRTLSLGVAGRILASPALWLLITGALAFPLLRVRRDQVPSVVWSSARRGAPVALTTMLFLLLGGVMAASGTSLYLAQAAAQLGSGYLLFIPVVGAIGGYITGSNSGASAMFSASTAQAALTIGSDPLIAVAAQNVGASAAVMASPPRVALAISVADTSVDEERESAPEQSHEIGLSPQVTRVVLLVATSVAITLGAWLAAIG